jgi:hypothetical protein
MESRMMYLSDLATRITSDKQLEAQLKENPAATLAKLAAPL